MGEGPSVHRKIELNFSIKIHCDTEMTEKYLLFFSNKGGGGGISHFGTEPESSSSD